MSLIRLKKTSEKQKIKLEINKDIYSEVEKYCTWAGIDQIDYFFEEAASFVFSKDKEWKAHQRPKKLKS